MASITVNNIKENEVLPHPLVIIDGTITNFASLGLATQQWFITASVDFQTGLSWPIAASGRFKAMVQVPNPGKYTVMLKVGSVSRAIPIEYKPVATANVVRFFYQKSSDASDNEGFDAPEGVDNSDDAALQRIRFNALLMQATTAEMFVNAGQPRKTFAMEFASDGLPVARLLRSSFTNATARTVNDQELFKLVDQDIVNQGLNSDPKLQFKHAVILGCAKYNTSTQKPEGHTALGGGKMGIFGSCGLHTWPRRLHELSACVLNNSRIDKSKLLDDSGGRGTYWGNFATGLGAFLHELGHAFGLPHTDTGIMSRDFDYMNRLLCVYQADFSRDQVAYTQKFLDGRLTLNLSVLAEVTAPNGAHWHPDSLALLNQSPWLVTHAKSVMAEAAEPSELEEPLP